MPGPLYHAGAVAMCPHGGTVMTTSPNARVLVSGMPIATMAAQSTVVGCAFTTPAGVPQPCVKVIWSTPAAMTLVMAQPALTALSVGLCIAANGVPGGPAVISSTQPRAIAT
jgi:hypothetical protein